jgi:predicted CXXCH cytochrome family protein
MMRRIIFLVSMTVLVMALTAGSALGYTDYVKLLSKQTTSTASVESAYALGCVPCHGWDKLAAPNTTNTFSVFSVRSSLLNVVNPAGVGNEPTMTDPANGQGGETWLNLYQQYGQPFGPHGGYSNTTDRCKVCHDVHAANGDLRLLPTATVADLCETCHDFTEGISIYGAIRATTGQAPAGVHRIYGLASSEGTTDSASGSLIPGGVLTNTNGTLNAGDTGDFPLTGGTTSFASQALASGEANLTCTDCHTPHGNTSMKPFKSDRVRLGTSILIECCNAQPSHITITQFGVPALNITAGQNLAGIELMISPNSPIYSATAVPPLGTAGLGGGGIADGRTANRVTSAGLAMAISLMGAGALTVTTENTTTVATGSALGFALVNAYLNRLPSNKLLRDYMNGEDLRTTKFGGLAASTAVRYNETLGQWDPILLTGGTTAPVADSQNAPWNNGQAGATSEYGSGFCYSCHKGRIGNKLPGTAAASTTRLNAGFTELGGNNHPTNMTTAYRSVGALANGLALSNQGFVMDTAAPASGSGGGTGGQAGAPTHPDGLIARDTAPICQQCHEDSRDVESAFSYTDTDKSVPFSHAINTLLGFESANPASVAPSFLYAGNPRFQNFPHETVNFRQLVEGGDSAQIGGGNNDDLCLNCHVPGSTVRPTTAYDSVPAGKDLNGYME